MPRTDHYYYYYYYYVIQTCGNVSILIVCVSIRHWHTCTCGCTLMHILVSPSELEVRVGAEEALIVQLRCQLKDYSRRYPHYGLPLPGFDLVLPS